MEASYLTTGHAARRLGIAKATLLRAMRRGAITPAAQTPGGCFRFRQDDVDAYARQLAALSSRSSTPHSGAVEAPCEQEARFQALVTATAHIVWNADGAGEVTDDLPLWRAFTGQTPAQI